VARPASAHEAVRQTHGLLARRLPGARRTTVSDHLARAAGIASCLYRRWQVGPYQWRLKHARWYLEHGMDPSFEPSVRYRYWLTLRLLVIALRKDVDWLPRLRGPWERPDPHDGARVYGGRPLKRPT
jgi:hypothetical protein